VETNFQRIGSSSNTHTGNEFEESVLEFFARRTGIDKRLQRSIGVAQIRKPIRFDFGSDDPPILIECKSHGELQCKHNCDT
jgi:hypothetical protein